MPCNQSRFAAFQVGFGVKVLSAVSQDDAIPGFLAGGGDAAAAIAAFDWSGTPLGPISGWPESVRTVVAMILRSPVPIATLWYPDGTMIYNDGYAVVAGERGLGLIGSSGARSLARSGRFQR